MAIDRNLLAKVEQYRNNPYAIAMLDAIGASEGTGNRYNIRFGGSVISDLSKHPNISTSYQTNMKDTRGRPIVEKSTAAGRYQFLNSTWNNIADKLGLNDFSAASQDKAALGLMLSVPGVEQALKNGDLTTLVQKLNSTWTSLPASVEGGKRHGLRPFEYVLGAFNQSLIRQGQKPVTATWNSKSYNNVAIPGGQQQQSLQFPSFSSMYGTRSPFLARTLTDIANRSYADAGAVPFQFGQSSPIAISANPDISDPANRLTLLQKLFNRDSNVQYGMSFYDGGIRPTIVRTGEDGVQTPMVEYPNGVYINPNTGERLDASGQSYPPVEYPEPIYDATTGVNNIPSSHDTEYREDYDDYNGVLPGATTGNAPLAAAPTAEVVSPASTPLPETVPMEQQLAVLRTAVGGNGLLTNLGDRQDLARQLVRQTTV